ncbi:hypothetical protein C5748_12965 [Phyllobacterium phragmitis]|uniref:histidine kinase n=1 Tax=Phyllobacterium phragmitis TaxID=2670329 RepID=A0A2S9IRF9_9HYPH|nr:HAMP domain-containing sensor histidine kinase [Phyllobacterium phragmitis]PRD43113.1 hypothetical protein C5748_12965 [Phyllobacterium phragmitis]
MAGSSSMEWPAGSIANTLVQRAIEYLRRVASRLQREPIKRRITLQYDPLFPKYDGYSCAKIAAWKCEQIAEIGEFLAQRGNKMNVFKHFTATAGDEYITSLKQASDFQAALLGMAGHDLRQPLHVIQSAYEWLESRVGSTSEKARLERGERAIARLTEQLDRLVGALRLYEYTKGIEASPIALSPLLARVGDESDDAAFEKDIDLRICQTTVQVMSHPVLLEGILRNLVRNSLKYTEPGGRILIGCRRSGPEVRVDVYDTGIGIAPEHLVRIFEAFQRLDSAQNHGLGIGLFVVRRAVELLGHRIEVSSAVSCGTRFSVFVRSAPPKRQTC